ncbi:MAG: peptidylprolyl isomerase [Ferruginibacter sp.]
MKRFKILMAALFTSVICFSVNAQVKKNSSSNAKPTTPVSNNNTKTPATATPAMSVTVKKDVSNAATIRVKITTDSGIMIVKLYDSTPLHRDNFVKLVKEGFYDSLLFHRIIPGFMIQGGDPTSKNAPAGVMLGSGGGNMERIPAEFKSDIIHKRGALCAARDGNPQKASSACQFYIVQGRPLSEIELNNYDGSRQVKYTPAQKAIYKSQGGTPMLDMNYTVFGEVESGMEVIDKIANAPRNPQDRPNVDIHMHMEIIK